MNRITVVLLCFLLFGFNHSFAQMPAGGKGMQNMNMGHFYGKIVDSATDKPIEDASVELIQNKMDSVLKKRKDVVIAGMLTDKKGEFSLDNLPVLSTFKLKIHSGRCGTCSTSASQSALSPDAWSSSDSWSGYPEPYLSKGLQENPVPGSRFLLGWRVQKLA